MCVRVCWVSFLWRPSKNAIFNLGDAFCMLYISIHHQWHLHLLFQCRTRSYRSTRSGSKKRKNHTNQWNVFWKYQGKDEIVCFLSQTEKFRYFSTCFPVRTSSPVDAKRTAAVRNSTQSLLVFLTSKKHWSVKWICFSICFGQLVSKPQNPLQNASLTE